MPDRFPGGSRLRFDIPTLLILLTAAVLWPRGAEAQIPAGADTVRTVEVVGNVTVDDDLVRRGFGIPVGSRFNADAVRRGIRRLYDLGFFNDIAVDADPSDGGIQLVLRVVENPRVSAVEFAGNDKIKDKDLLERTGRLTTRMADDRTLAKVERDVARAYGEKGYIKAQVRPRYLPADSDARRILLVEVEEGPKMRIEDIRFVGNHRVEEGALRGAMEQGTTGFLKGGVYKPVQLEGDPGRIEAEFRKRGFRDAEVLGYELLPGSDEDRLVVEIEVNEGPRYHAGAVSWEGNEVIPAPALYSITSIGSGDVFNQEKIEETITNAYGAYAEQGYIYLNVRPDYATVDTTVNVTFRVTEGKPSRIHDIQITGNTRTKERVIRRTLALRPGDLFRRNALIRSMTQLQQLGYFSDIQPNSTPVDTSKCRDCSPNDITLSLHVEERQVGTASAGAGFSSAVGLTGFVELGHTNLFGNGQSLNLRLERGSRRNNAEISFTEPWFLGTPTSVGVDLFSTNRLYRGTGLDLDVRRLGGALRLGRPFLWDYTRVFASYRIESQKVVDETGGFTVSPNTTRLVETGFQVSQETSLSSAFSLTFTRNSTNHPIYASSGSEARLRMEFSGGPFGGDQVFQKYDLDFAKFLPTIRSGGFAPILMLRSRVGVVDDLFRDRDDPLLPVDLDLVEALLENGQAPTWRESGFALGPKYPVPVPVHITRYPTESAQLFRLGGTSVNALRGYDDFEIVPPQNRRTRFLVSQFTDSTGASTYDVASSPVYFPGGQYSGVFTAEWGFPIVEPLHGLLFAEGGGTWNEVPDFRWDTIRRSLGFGFRMEVPLLGLVGFDYAYGFDRLNRRTGQFDEGGWKPHIQFGRIF